jgi:hypothetical protein
MGGEEEDKVLIVCHPPTSSNPRKPVKAATITKNRTTDLSAAPTRNTNCKQLLHILSWTYSTGDPICSGLHLP